MSQTVLRYHILNTMSTEENLPQFETTQLKPRKRWFKRWGIWGIVAVILVVGYSAYNFGMAYNTIVVDNGDEWVDTVLNSKGHKDDDLNPLPKDSPDRLDILILGMRGEGDVINGGLLTDSIEVLSLDEKTKKASIISIPRDLWVDLLGIEGKINETYAIGYAHNAGIPLTSQLISRIAGVRIDKTVVFNFKAFQDIVESIGGIDIHLDKPFKEATQWGYEFSLPAGENHLDGEQALYYVRSRYSSSDFDRARRQQQIMIAIEKKATSLGLLANPLKVNNLFSSIKNNIRTDFQIWDINNLLNLASVFSSPSTIQHYILSTENLLYEAKGPNEAYILLPRGDNYNLIKEKFKTILD